MNKNHIAVRLYLCFAMAITMVSAQVQGIEGDTMRITCNVAGTLPRWNKDSNITFTIEGYSKINPEYSTRFSYAADQKTLIVSPVQPSDAGTYGCLIGGVLGTDVVVSVLKPEEDDCYNPCHIVNVVRAFFVLAIVVITVVIIDCCFILISAEKWYKKMKAKQEDNNATTELVILIIAAVLFITVFIWFIVMQTTVEDCEKMTKKECNNNNRLLAVEIFVFVLGVIANIRAYICHKRMKMKIMEIIRKIITSAYPWIISVEDLERILVGVERPIIVQQLEELQKENKIHLRTRGGYVRGNYILKTGQKMIGNCREKIFQILTDAYPDILTKEDLRTIMGVKADIIKQELRKLKKEDLIISRHDGFVVKDHISKTETTLDYPTSDKCGGVKKPPSPGCERDTADVSPQHRPKPPLPPEESVSRKNVKLDPIRLIRKNNSTTEFHMDNPGSEQSNINTSNRGLSTVIDQEFDQAQTNRLAPLDHTVMDESINRKKKKKKKKTKTNNDDVKFDNDND